MISVNFYDRRLACPAAGTAQAGAAGLPLDAANPNYAASMPPYGAASYSYPWQAITLGRESFR